jgi:hypothetical protein
VVNEIGGSRASRIDIIGGGMDSINVRDLPEEQAQLVSDFVEFLRRKLATAQAVPGEESEERGWVEASAMSFAKDWDNELDAVYDHWREHYHVPEG